MMMDKCRLCGEEGKNLSPIFSGKLNIDGRIVTCLPIKIMESNDLPQQICYSCANVVDISYKIILKSMEIDDEFRRSIIKNLENQKANINHLHNGQMEPQVLLISHHKNHGDSVKKFVVVKNEEEKMEIDVEPHTLVAEERFFNQDIKIYCYYEDKDEEIIRNSFSQRFQRKTILTEHSYASTPGLSTSLSDNKVNLNNQNMKLTIAKVNLPVLRDHNYFKKINDPELIDNYENYYTNEMSMDHDYYEKNSFSRRKKICMDSYPCKLYERAFTSLMSLDKHEYMNTTDGPYPWEFRSNVTNESSVEDEGWMDNQRHDYVFVKCVESL